MKATVLPATRALSVIKIEQNIKTALRQSTATSSKKDKIQIECDSDHDHFSPKNWSLIARSKNIAVLSLLIFVQAYAGASDSIANTSISQEFHVSNTAENLATAMYLFGTGSGCLIVGPLSETIGRNPVYLGMTFGYLFFVLGSALVKNYGGQIVCRFLVDLFASGLMGINGASVKDLFRPVKRAFVFSVVAWVNVVRECLYTLGGSTRAQQLTMCSSYYCAYSRWMGRHPHFLALGRVDNSHHFWIRLPGRLLLPSRNPPPRPSGLESKAHAACHR
jgi:MFS family permease